MSGKDLRKGYVRRKRSTRAWVSRTKFRRKGIRHTSTSIRIRKINVRKIDDRSKRRNSYDIFKCDGIRRLVIIAGSAAETGFPICRQLRRKSYAWAKIPEIVVDRRCRTSRIMIVPAKEQAYRRIWVTHGLCPRHVACASPFTVFVWDERIPA